MRITSKFTCASGASVARHLHLRGKAGDTEIENYIEALDQTSTAVAAISMAPGATQRF
jgi:hypothetical protein